MATRETQSKPAGLVLSGGGARGAYQAGVLKAVAEICGEKCEHPFSILTGVSAGAINAYYWAASAGGPEGSATGLVKLWSELRTEEVFRVDFPSLSRIATEWSTGLMWGGFSKKGGGARALLDTSPLRHLLERVADFSNLQRKLSSGDISAVAVSATEYATSDNVTFVQSAGEVPLWERGRRKSERAELNVDHLMGSAAIPLFFPPIKIGERYFGDGCLRNTAPLSPAVHLGARRLLIVGVRKMGSSSPVVDARLLQPSIGRILSVLLNAVLLDGVDLDVEVLMRNNAIVAEVADYDGVQIPLEHVDFVWIRPSQDIAHIALEEARAMPRLLRYLVGGLGSRAEAAELISYLLFEPSFCQRLIALGYRDAMNQKEAIETLLNPELSTNRERDTA